MLLKMKKFFVATCIVFVTLCIIAFSDWTIYENFEVAQSSFLSRKDLTAQRTCSPKKHIGFMKTHKCGSSTLQNIFFRYGRKHNLSFVLPEQSHVILNNCNPFETSLVYDTPWHFLGYDMLVQHVIWNTKEIKKLMPSDTVYVQIIRDPVALTESLYGYIELENILKMNLSQFALEGKDTKYYTNRFTCFGRNQIVFDFGLDLFQFDNDTAVKEKIKEADELFDLVLIAEFYEESIILLKDLLCWEIDDVSYLKLNFRKSDAIETLTDREKMGIREMNLADQMYYDHFLGKLKMKMREYGEERLKEESDLLRKKNEQIFNTCVTNINNGNEIEDKRFRALGHGALGYEMNDAEECVAYARNEPSFTIMLREIQIERSQRRAGQT